MEGPGDDLALMRRWQLLHLREKCADLDPTMKADLIRNQLELVEWSQASKVLPCSAARHLMLQYADKYASIIDSPTEHGGVNNFAEAALALQAGRRNESKDWHSSLSREKMASMGCVQAFLKKAKVAAESIIPAGKENQTVHLSNPSQHVNSKFKPSLGRSSSHPQTQHTAVSANQEALYRTSTSGTSGHHSGNQPCSMVAQPRQHPSFSNSHNSTNTANRNNQQDFQQNSRRFNIPEDSAMFANKKSLFSSASANTNSVSNNTGNMPPYKKPEHATKRSFHEVDEENEDDGPVVGAFKTAREQLVIDQHRKHGGGRGRGGGHAPQPAPVYGTGKKSLGTRRATNNKFVPPVRDEDGDGGVLVRKAGPGGANRSSEQDEPVDERLKNIEPKMIELITNEIMDHGPPMTWEDIAGLEFAKKTIKEIVVWPMLRPDIFTGLRGPPKGLLLFGPPGTGKTLIGKCIACQSKSTFFSISASCLTSKWVGEGEKMVRALFAVARVHQPSVVFIDELDSLLGARSDGEHDASRRIKTEFLVQLDGAGTSSEDRILVVGATNRPQEIDEAARRRFVKRLYIPLPEAVARRHIITNLLTSQPHDLNDHQLDVVMNKTDGYSGADMANLCREAALGPIRSISLDDIENITADQVRPISHVDFKAALLQVRASVSDKDLNLYIEWNKQYGSWEL